MMKVRQREGNGSSYYKTSHLTAHLQHGNVQPLKAYD